MSRKAIGVPRSFFSMYSLKLWILLKSTICHVRFPEENCRIPTLLEPFAPLTVVDLINAIGDPRSISLMYSLKLWILLKSTSFGVRFPVAAGFRNISPRILRLKIVNLRKAIGDPRSISSMYSSKL